MALGPHRVVTDSTDVYITAEVPDAMEITNMDVTHILFVLLFTNYLRVIIIYNVYGANHIDWPDSVAPCGQFVCKYI